MINFYNLKEQYADQREEIQFAINDVAMGGQYFADKSIKQFEHTVSSNYGNAAVSLCNSGTTALTNALKSLNVTKNSLVAVPAISYIATANAVLAAGLYPVCVDIDDSWLMNINQLEQQTSETDRFSTVVVVDLFGQGVNLKKFKDFCDSKNYRLVVDAAQSYMMYYGDYAQVDHCDALSLSFNPLKNLGAMGNAGAVVSRKYKKEWLDHWSVQGKFNNKLSFGGHNGRMDAVQAAVLNVKHQLFEKNMSRKTEISWYYRECLESLVPMPVKNNITTHMNYVFPIAPKNPDRVRAALTDADIEFACHYDKPMHHYELFGSFTDYCPRATSLTGRCISLPNHWHLTDAEVEKVVQIVKSAL